MKKLLTFCLLVATAFNVNAQTFEETVKYINEKISCCSDYKDEHISCSIDGDIKWYSAGKDHRINLFDLLPEDQNLTYVVFNSNGIIIYDYTSSFYVRFKISGETETLNIFPVQADAERVCKALLHLKSVCTKRNDPFDK